jgi:photosystem II stability/assembly factor-like uncharacterized protein
LNKVVFVSSLVGFAVGNEGILIKTVNGGDSWTVINTGTTYDLYSIALYASDVAYLVGQYGTALKTVNGGTNWTVLNTGTDYNLYDVSIVADDAVFTVGDVALLLNTANGGTTWNTLKPADGSYVDVRRYHQEVLYPEKWYWTWWWYLHLRQINRSIRSKKRQCIVQPCSFRRK